MKITICYVTSRRTPKWDWFVSSLVAQTTPEQRADLQVVFIDGHLWKDLSEWKKAGSTEIQFGVDDFHDQARRDDLKAIIDSRFHHWHIPPKPCAYQGPFRQTTKDFFCAANSRNTAFIVAQHQYVVFVDDLSVLFRGWFDQALHAAQGDYVVCGVYRKVLNLSFTIDPWNLKWTEFPPGVDSRQQHCSKDGIVPWHGSGLFGCSFGLPLEAALEVDGHDMATCSQGAEDYDIGIRLERAGWPILLNGNMATLESEEDHHTEESLARIRKEVSPDRLPPGYDGERWSDHVMLNRLIRETGRILPLIGDNLRAVRERYQATGLVPIPRVGVLDWRDGRPISQL